MPKPLTLLLPAVLAPALLMTHGCAKQAARSDAPMDAAAGADMGEMQDASSDPLAELDVLEARMRGMGLPTGVDRERAAKGAAMDDAEGDAAAGEDEQAEAPAEEELVPEAAPTAANEPGAGPYRDGPRGEAANYCTDVCSLSESICQLEVRICELSEDHAGDPTYADACERAIDDCEVAGDACNTCDA